MILLVMTVVYLCTSVIDNSLTAQGTYEHLNILNMTSIFTLTTCPQVDFKKTTSLRVSLLVILLTFKYDTFYSKLKPVKLTLPWKFTDAQLS